MTIELQQRIARMTDQVAADEAAIGVLSTGEKIAVALVLDRPELFPGGRGRAGYTILEAVDRLGIDWFKAALSVQKARDV